MHLVHIVILLVYYFYRLDANYDVVISAIKLPDMTGFELLMKLRELGESVPLIMMTGTMSGPIIVGVLRDTTGTYTLGFTVVTIGASLAIASLIGTEANLGATVPTGAAAAHTPSLVPVRSSRGPRGTHKWCARSDE